MTSILASRNGHLALIAGDAVVVPAPRNCWIQRLRKVSQSLARHEAADLVPHHGLQIVREARDRQDVRQLRRQPRVGVGRIRVVQLGLLRRLHAEERGVVGALAVHQRNEAQIRQLLFAPVGDGRLRWGTSWPRRPQSVLKLWIGRPSTRPPPSTPRMAAHQPYLAKALVSRAPSA